MQEVFDIIDRDEAISFLQSLVRAESINPPGTERVVVETIEEHLAAAGVTAETYKVQEERPNLLASLSGESSSGEDEKRVLVYSGHFDTVPLGNANWEYDPLGGESVRGRIYGRGTTDMKGGVAAMVLALEYLKRSGTQLGGELRFVGTVGEEVDGLGAREVVKKGQIDDATALVVGEPSANGAFVAHKGTLWVEVSISGRTAHGSMPENGVNAIDTMRHFLNWLEGHSFIYEEHPLLGGPTVNIGTIEGGVKTNVVADECSATLDLRTVPGQSHEEMLSEAKRALAEICRNTGASYEVRVVNDMAPVATPENDPFIGLCLDTAKRHLGRNLVPEGAKYYTDASVYVPYLGLPALIYGPGEPSMAHQPDEWVDVENFLESIRFYVALAVEYLGVV